MWTVFELVKKLDFLFEGVPGGFFKDSLERPQLPGYGVPHLVYRSKGTGADLGLHHEFPTQYLIANGVHCQKLHEDFQYKPTLCQKSQKKNPE